MLKAKKFYKRITKEHHKHPKTKCWPEAVGLALGHTFRMSLLAQTSDINIIWQMY